MYAFPRGAWERGVIQPQRVLLGGVCVAWWKYWVEGEKVAASVASLLPRKDGGGLWEGGLVRARLGRSLALPIRNGRARVFSFPCSAWECSLSDLSSFVSRCFHCLDFTLSRCASCISGSSMHSRAEHGNERLSRSFLCSLRRLWLCSFALTDLWACLQPAQGARGGRRFRRRS